MADSKRRGEEPADDDPELELFDDDAPADVDDVVDAEDAEDADETPVGRGGRRGGTATKERPKAERPVKRDTERLNPFARIGRFVREVVAELRKVIWPTRKELLTYTAVVVVFVAVMLTIVALLDYGFARLVLAVFGGSSTTPDPAVGP